MSQYVARSSSRRSGEESISYVTADFLGLDSLFEKQMYQFEVEIRSFEL